MNRIPARLLGRLAAGLLIAASAMPLTQVARATDKPFTLNNAGFAGSPGTRLGSFGAVDQTFVAVEIRATPNATGKYDLEANDAQIPLSWEWADGQGKTVTGTGSFLMKGAYDPATNAVTGTFTLENEATGTLNYKATGDLLLKYAKIWKGDVTGSVKDNVAGLQFSGSDTSVCSLGADDCGSTGTMTEAVWFAVTGGAAAETPPPGPTTGEPEEYVLGLLMTFLNLNRKDALDYWLRALKAHDLSTSTDPEDKAAVASADRPSQEQKEEARSHNNQAYLYASDNLPLALSEADKATELDRRDWNNQYLKAALALANGDGVGQNHALGKGLGLQMDALSKSNPFPNLSEEEKRDEFLSASTESYVIELFEIGRQLKEGSPEFERVKAAYCAETGRLDPLHSKRLRDQAAPHALKVEDPFGLQSSIFPKMTPDYNPVDSSFAKLTEVQKTDVQWPEVRKGCP